MATSDDGSTPRTMSAEDLDEVLQGILVGLTSLKRKPRSGYRGKVTPLKVIPLVIGIGEDEAYKLMDIREALDDDPDAVWHDWLKLYGSDFDPEGRRPAGDQGRIGVLDILRVVAGGGGPSGASGLVEILKRLAR